MKLSPKTLVVRTIILSVLLFLTSGCAAINPLFQITTAGSGFIVTSKGYILTNEHVIQYAKNIKVFTSTRSEGYTADVIQADASIDLALIKISATGLKHVLLGDSSRVSLLDPVLAMGFLEPEFGKDLTVSSGKVTSIRTNVEGREGQKTIQHDAVIAHGSSGGPLFDRKGQVIGINYAFFEDSGLSLSIPINDAIPLLNVIPGFDSEDMGTSQEILSPEEIISKFRNSVVYIEARLM